MIVEVQGSELYKVNTEELTCTCRHWIYRCKHFTQSDEGRLCKHLKQVFEERPELKPVYLAQLDNYEEQASKDSDGKVRYPRFLFDDVINLINSVMFTNSSIIDKYEFCGSYRRGLPRISDIDVLIIMKEGHQLSEIATYIESTLGSQVTIKFKGDVKIQYRFDKLFPVDLRVVSEEEWPFALLYFTGSKYENIRMRRIANSKGLSLSEYGFTKDSDPSTYLKFDLKTEESIYEFLEVPYKAPKNR